MLGVTFFGLFFTPAFDVLLRMAAQRALHAAGQTRAPLVAEATAKATAGQGE
jgi:hypothetical protein